MCSSPYYSIPADLVEMGSYDTRVFRIILDIIFIPLFYASLEKNLSLQMEHTIFTHFELNLIDCIIDILSLLVLSFALVAF